MSDTPEFMTHERIMTGEEYVSYSDYLSLQRERDEALMDRNDGDIATMTRNYYERLIKERDEAKYKLEDARQSLEVALEDLSEAKRERDEAIDAMKTCRRVSREDCEQNAKRAEELHVQNLTLERERDEAQATLTDIHRWIERNHPDGFIDSMTFHQNLERVTDRWYDRFNKLERERDEAREKAERYRMEANALMMQRDELLERNAKLRDIADRALMLNQSQ
jgi:DNA repair exonuclease SbcCD ATPase subunit